MFFCKVVSITFSFVFTYFGEVKGILQQSFSYKLCLLRHRNFEKTPSIKSVLCGAGGQSGHVKSVKKSSINKSSKHAVNLTVSKLLGRSTSLSTTLVKNLQHLFPVTLEMLFLQSVRFTADRPHGWVSGAGWGRRCLWPKARARRSGSSATTESVWKQISTQVAPMARTCQRGMLDASGN